MTSHTRERVATLRTCPDCSAEFYSNTPRKTDVRCPDCRKTRKIEQVKLWHAEHCHEARKRSTQPGPGRSRAYTVEFDPDTRGGFPAGNTLDRKSVDSMLMFGHFNIGTILSRDGQRYKVIGWGPQKLEAMK